MKEHLEQRAQVAHDMNNLSALVAREGRTMTAEELETFDKMDAAFRDLSEKIETEQRIKRAADLRNVENGKAKAYKPTVEVTRQDRELAFKAWALNASGKSHAMTERHRQAVEKTGTNMNSDRFAVSLSDDGKMVARAQTSTVDSQGGYLMNDGILQGLERNLVWYGGARQIARVLRTDSGEPISYAYADDTANVGSWLGQTSTVSNTNVVYQKKVLGEYTATTAVYPVSVQLLQDARIPVSEDIGEALGQRLGRLTNTAYTTGTAGGPTGFVTDGTVGKTCASASAITYAELVDFAFSIDKSYRDDPSFVYTMSDSTLSYLWKIVDGQSRPLFWNQMGSLADPNNGLTLFGKRIVVNNDMASISTGNKVIAAIVGSKFVIRDVKEAEVVVLRERFMDQLSVGFMAYLRTDSKLLNPNCCKLLKMA